MKIFNTKNRNLLIPEFEIVSSPIFKLTDIKLRRFKLMADGNILSEDTNMFAKWIEEK